MAATTDVRTLRLALRATMPLADDDGRRPFIDCVRLEIGGATLTATATDRYAASHVQLPGAGDLSPVLLYPEDCRLILRALDDHPQDATVTIGRTGRQTHSHLWVAVETITGRHRRVTVPVGPPAGEFPMGKLTEIEEATRDLPPASGPLAVTLGRLDLLLRTIRPLAQEWDRDRGVACTPLRVAVGAATPEMRSTFRPPIRLELAPWWLGLVTPHRSTPGPAAVHMGGE